MSRAELRLVELETAAQVAKDPKDVALILAEEKAIRATLSPSKIDEVAQGLLRLASNPDHVRELLAAGEKSNPGLIDSLQKLLNEKRES